CSGLFVWCCGVHRGLRSFPTRRSSDLEFRYQPEGAVSATTQKRRSRFAPDWKHRLPRPEMHWVSGTVNEQSPWLSETHVAQASEDRKSTRLNSSHVKISYAVFCLKKKK